MPDKPEDNEQKLDKSTDEKPAEPPVEAASAEQPVPAPDQVEVPKTDLQLGLPKKKLWQSKAVLIGAAVVLVAVVAGAWMMMSGKSDDTASTQSSESSHNHFGVAVGLVEGSAEFSEDGSEWKKLESSTELDEGNSVRTGADGRVVLLIDDGSAVRLGFNSSLKLTSLATDDMVITNSSGEIYSRVVASETRKYNVEVGEESYEAKGTAFRTSNTDKKKGVEVFQSIVEVGSKTLEVPEGSQFFSEHEQDGKEGAVSALDLEALKGDEFVKWNSEQDKKDAEHSKKLGILTELDKPPVTPEPAPGIGQGISLSGSVSEYTANFSWKVSGVDTSQGFKLVKSKTSKTPTYPNDGAAYVEAGRSSYSMSLGDGRTYYFRICAYRGDSCVSYSNTVTITTPEKPIEKPVTGAVNLIITGNTASWTYEGTAPHGFKLVISEAPGMPSYGNASFTKYTSSPHEIEGLGSGTYNVRVCKYTASDYEGGCMNYSNHVEYVVL